MLQKENKIEHRMFGKQFLRCKKRHGAGNNIQPTLTAPSTFIARTLHYTTWDTRLTLWNSLGRPRLEDEGQLWSPVYPKDRDRLKKGPEKDIIYTKTKK